MLEPRVAAGLLDWARAHVYAVEGPLVAENGGAPVAWAPETFPLQKTILEAIADTRWQRVVLMTAPQAFGKTVGAAVPTLLHALAERRVNALYVAGDESLAKKQWSDKIKPAFEADADLHELLHENPDLGGNWEERIFTNGAALHFAGGQQPLAAFTAPVIVFDDVQHYPPTLPAGRGHTVDDGLKRSHAFAPDMCTHVLIGTATNVEAYLWRALIRAAAFVPLLPCPGCGGYQLLEYERLEFDREDAVAAVAETWMRCASEKCRHRIRFEELPAMLAEHRWSAVPSDEIENVLGVEGTEARRHADTEGEAEGAIANLQSSIANPDWPAYPETRANSNVAGFWANSLYWPHGKSWGERALDWLGAWGDPDKLRDFQINDQVRPWKEPEIDEERLTVQELESHVLEGYAARTVPDWADVVTVMVDVQSGYLYYIIRAWKKADGTSALVDAKTIGKPIRGGGQTEDELRARRAAGIIAGLDELDALVAQGWPLLSAEGEIVGRIEARVGLIDRGYEPEIIAGWWSAKHRGFWKMIKGQKAGTRAVLWPLHRREGLRSDARGRPWRLVDVNAAKHVLRRLLRIPRGQPGYWHIPASGLHVNTLRSYYRHLGSERWRKDLTPPRWKKITEGVENHYLDDETYGISAARACGVLLVGFEPPRPVTRRRAAGRRVPERKVRRSY